MLKRYLSVGNWYDKASGQPKTSLGEISEGVNKNGKGYQITNTENTVIVDGTYAVGTILSANMTLMPETSDKAPQIKA